MNLYQGVIEDVDDPLKLGRVRVRVFGLHTDDKALIPTESLPWATVAIPATSASISGIGFSPTGLLPGSWVILYFQDPDEQYPIVLASIHGIPKDPLGQVAADEEVEFSDAEAPTNENVLKDSSGAPVTDGSGEPIKTTPSDDPTRAEKRKVVRENLGSVSGKYESNGDPGTINSYKSSADRGGASYGAYQLASFIGADGNPTRPDITIGQTLNSPVVRYIRTSGYASLFAGLSAATSAFDSAWRDIARVSSAEFLKSQHKFIEREYYEPAIAKLPASITDRGRAVHEAIWSMSVQLGVQGAISKIKSVVGTVTGKICDDKIIELIYDDRIKTVRQDFASSPALWNGLLSRFRSEKAELIAIAKSYEKPEECGEVSQEEKKKTVYTQDGKTQITEKVTTAIVNPKTKGERGFSDPNKKYPLYYEEADTNRLARGVITETIVESKRSGIVTGKEAGDEIISEPPTQYNTKYPFNKVIATTSGHVIEIDDTEGHERVNIHHKSGTFIEFHPDGQLVTKVQADSTVVVNANENKIVIDNQNTHVGGNSNGTVNGTMNLNVYGTVNIRVDADCNLDVTGNCNVTASIINLN